MRIAAGAGSAASAYTDVALEVAGLAVVHIRCGLIRRIASARTAAS